MAYLSQRNGKWHLTWKEGRSVKRKSTGCTLDQRAKAEVLLEQFELELKLERIDPTVKYRNPTRYSHLAERKHRFHARSQVASQGRALDQVANKLRAAVSA